MHKVYCELYKTDLTVCFDKETFSRKFGCNGDYGGCVVQDGRTINIYLKKLGEGINVSDCSHEAYHAADFIADLTGMITHKDSGNEHIAYLVGWIVDKIFDCLELDNQWEDRQLNKPR
jgi:hypothetical protein